MLMESATATSQPNESTRLALLEEMKADGVRVLREQTEGIFELDAKARQVVVLAVTALAAGVALGGFFADHSGNLDAVSKTRIFGLLGVGVAFDLGALVCLAQAYSGLWKVRRRGSSPDLHWLVQQANDETVETSTYRIAVIQGFQIAFQKNTLESRRLVRYRNAGAWLLFAAIGAYILAAFEFVRLGV